MNSSEAKKVILNTVIELISSKPLSKLTIREIASKSSMNVAAINYHFGSKEILLNETMKYYWSSLCRIYEKIMTEKNLSPQTIHAYCKEIMYFYYRSNGILRSEQSLFSEHGMDEDTKQRIELQFNAISHLILSIKPQTRKEDLVVKSVRFISTLAHPALFVELYDNIAPKGISMDEFLDHYINDAIENI